MNTTRRQLCFLGPALCAVPALGSTVEKLLGSEASCNGSASNPESFPSKELFNLVIGGSHEIASQLMLIAGWTYQVQEELEYADPATLKCYLHAVQEATQRASVMLNRVRNETRTKHAPRSRRSRPAVSDEER
jgi:hypothetical protein